MTQLQLRCLVGGTDLINDSPPRLRLDDTTVTLVGEGAVLSTAELGINTYAGGGGLSFRSKVPVRFGVFDLDSNFYVMRWFDGVISQPDGAMEGDSAVYKLPCQGADLKLDALSYHAQDGSKQFIIIQLAADTFYNQVLAAHALVSAGAATPLDLSDIPLTGVWATALDLLVIDAPQTLRDLLTTLCQNLTTAVHTADPTSTFTPAFAVIPRQEATTAFGTAQLVFWDLAQQTHADLIVNCDTPGLGEISPVSAIRKLDGSQQGTGAVAVGADGIVGTARAAAGIIAQFPNPADPDNIWWLPKVEDQSWTTQEDVDAAAARILAAHQYDRESIEVSVWDYFLRPGQFIHFKHSIWGIDAIYQVAQTQITWKDRKGPTRPLYTYQLGARLLQYGDKDNSPLVSSLPQIITPDPPSNLRIIDHGYDGSTHTSYLHWAWDASHSRNVAYYVPEVRIAGVPTGRSPGPVYGLDLLVTSLPPSTGVTLTLRAATFTHQFSDPVTSSIEVTDPPDSPLPPSDITFGTGYWDAGGAVQPIGLVLPTVHADYTRIHVAEIGAAPTAFPDLVIVGSQTTATLYGLHRGVGYTVTVNSETRWGDRGSTYSENFTAATESPAAPTGLSATYGVDSSGLGTGGFLKVTFTASSFTPLAYYEIEITEPSGPYRRATQILRADAVNFQATSLPVGVALRMNMRAISGYGYYPGPYTANLNFTIGANDPPAPTSIVRGTPDWDLAGVKIPISWTLPSPVPTSIRIRVYYTATPTNEVFNQIVPGTTTSYILTGLIRGIGYTISLTSLTGRGEESSTPATDPFTAPTESPPAPTGISITRQGVTVTGGYLKIAFTGTTWPNLDRYQCWIALQAGGDPILPPIDLAPSGGVWPVEGTLTGLPTNRALRLTLVTMDAWGFTGPASAPVDFSIGPVPSGQPPPVGETDRTASVALDNAQPAGWTEEITGLGTPGNGGVVVDIPTYLGLDALVSPLLFVSSSHAWVSDPLQCQEGITYQIWAARMASVATGTAQLLVRWYAFDNSLISTSTVWSATPTTGWIETPKANQTATAPTTAVYARILVKGINTGTPFSLYWVVDESRWRPQITAPALADKAVQNNHLADQPANTIAAGPTSGGTGAAAFRTLVVADLPAGSVTTFATIAKWGPRG